MIRHLLGEVPGSHDEKQRHCIDGVKESQNEDAIVYDMNGLKKDVAKPIDLRKTDQEHLHIQNLMGVEIEFRIHVHKHQCTG